MSNTVDDRHTLALQILYLKKQIQDLEREKKKASEDLLTKMMSTNKEKEEFFEVKVSVVQSWDKRLDTNILYQNLVAQGILISKDDWELLLDSSKLIKPKKAYVLVS